MKSENLEAIYCQDDGEKRVFCKICDNLCVERFYKDHLKSQTHTNKIRKRERSNKRFQIIFFK